MQKRAPPTIAVGFGSESTFMCSQDQLDKINQAIEEARQLASFSARFLEEPEAENSRAYNLWFGHSNTERKNSIMENHFQKVTQILRRPTQFLGSIGPGRDPTSITFACVKADFPKCNEVVAMAIEDDPTARNNWRGNMIILCPTFFKLRTTTREMIDSITESQIAYSGGFSLLHEVQHLGIIVGEGNVCADYTYNFKEYVISYH
ncbi:hypothetical protein IAQ61_009073 [Plenodomus lingam]|uniref:uncharacterized protein n=1 Tax=Leptosphaeria maculans TaxID=5022 RepID=UPI0033279F5D|nr:hypothetical protein IAQ61_009073 [Plenodomus lingam]